MSKKIYVHVVMKNNVPKAVFYDVNSALEYAKINLAVVVSNFELKGLTKDVVCPTLAISTEPPF